MQRFLPLIVAALALLATDCHRTKKQPVRMPPLEVEVTRAELDSVPNRMSFIGYLASNFNAVIQPRVSGYLTSKRYSNGMPVKRGQLLFTINPDQLSTTLLSARASLESARAQAVEAKNNYERAVPLARINAISQTQLDQYTAQYAAAQAAVHSAEQSFNNARLEVGYTKIYAPIDGMIETTSAHVGDYVGPGTQFEVLTTISNLDTMLVDLALPMAQYLRYAGSRPSIYENADLLENITLHLANDSIYPIPGLYDYTRKNVSNTMGTIVIVVMFPNPDLTLKPGQFARVTADVGATLPRVVVPQRSVSQTQGINSVWVVRPDSTVEYRRVELGPTWGDGWCIEAGIEAGETVLVTGLQKVRTGSKVIPRMTRRACCSPRRPAAMQATPADSAASYLPPADRRNTSVKPR